MSPSLFSAIPMQDEHLDECHTCLDGLDMEHAVSSADDRSIRSLMALLGRSDSKAIGVVESQARQPYARAGAPSPLRHAAASPSPFGILMEIVVLLTDVAWR